MKICDRCKASAVDVIQIHSTDEWFDVCAGCLYEVKEFIQTEKAGFVDGFMGKLEKLTKPAKNAKNK